MTRFGGNKVETLRSVSFNFLMQVKMKQTVMFEDKGVRKRAVIAWEARMWGDATSLMPLDEGVIAIGGTSDHTVLDITDI